MLSFSIVSTQQSKVNIAPNIIINNTAWHLLVKYIHMRQKLPFKMLITKLDMSSLNNNLSTGSERSIRARRNIALSFILKLLNIAVQFVLVPLLLDYLTPVKYGIWLTVVSIINWFNLFDVGIGNGLRFKLADVLAKNDNEQARTYISTSYAALTILALVYYVLFLMVFRFLNWQTILNAPKDFIFEIERLILIAFTFFSVNFVIRLISSVLYADQKSSMNDLLYAISNLLSLLFVFTLMQISSKSLIWVGICIGFSTFLPITLGSIFLYKRQYHYLRPALKNINFKIFNKLASLGIRYFALQIAVVIVFSTDNIIIAHLFGPAEVSVYDICLKYFSIAQSMFMLLLTPLWSAYTDAYAKGDLIWIKKKIMQSVYSWFLVITLIVIMTLLSNFLIEIWIGNRVKIPFTLTGLMAVFTVISIWNNIFAFFLNGAGKIKISVYCAIFSAIINIPLSILFGLYFRLGIQGIILGTIVSLLISTFLQPLQTYRLIRCTAIGIWAE